MVTTTSTGSLYGLSETLAAIWKRAEARYREGERNPRQAVSADDQATLAALGLGVMDVYDYVEDSVSSGEPDLGTFLLITAERVFAALDDGSSAPAPVRAEDLPPKEAAVRGIEWLPRILAKARAKLQGALPEDLMYDCGGDRRFLREHGIHPAEFLRQVRLLGEDEAIFDWVEKVSRSRASSPE
jgi:hypothetical protein